MCPSMHRKASRDEKESQNEGEASWMEVSETEMLTKNYLAANNLETLHLNLDLHPNQKPTSVKAN